MLFITLIINNYKKRQTNLENNYICSVSFIYETNIKIMPKKYINTINAIIDEHPYKVFTTMEFITLWQKARNMYGFSSFSMRKFAQRLSEFNFIEKVSMADNERSVYLVYGIRNKQPDIFDFAAARSRSSYFSYYTALFIHGLTLQIPKHIYLTNERGTRNLYDNTITQEAIDNAFSKSPRETNNLRFLKDYTIHQIHGRANNKLGVISYRENLAVTDIERTLIDVVTRSFYAGGVTQVIEGFKNAKEKINIEKLLSYYKEMNFIYPYHQAIGFYLEKAGYEEKAFIPFLQMEQKFKFYLSYNIRFKEFSSRWNLYYPKGL